MPSNVGNGSAAKPFSRIAFGKESGGDFVPSSVASFDAKNSDRFATIISHGRD